MNHINALWTAIIGCYAMMGLGMAGMSKWIADRANEGREREDDLMEQLRKFELQVVTRLTAIETELKHRNNPGDDD